MAKGKKKKYFQSCRFDNCGRKFNSFFKLEKHLKELHGYTDDRIYLINFNYDHHMSNHVCPRCSHTTKKSSNIDRHIASVHPEEVVAIKDEYKKNRKKRVDFYFEDNLKSIENIKNEKVKVLADKKEEGRRNAVKARTKKYNKSINHEIKKEQDDINEISEVLIDSIKQFKEMKNKNIKTKEDLEIKIQELLELSTNKLNELSHMEKKLNEIDDKQSGEYKVAENEYNIFKEECEKLKGNIEKLEKDKNSTIKIIETIERAEIAIKQKDQDHIKATDRQFEIKKDLLDKFGKTLKNKNNFRVKPFSKEYFCNEMFDIDCIRSEGFVQYMFDCMSTVITDERGNEEKFMSYKVCDLSRKKGKYVDKNKIHKKDKTSMDLGFTMLRNMIENVYEGKIAEIEKTIGDESGITLILINKIMSTFKKDNKDANIIDIKELISSEVEKVKEVINNSKFKKDYYNRMFKSLLNKLKTEEGKKLKFNCEIEVYEEWIEEYRKEICYDVANERNLPVLNDYINSPYGTNHPTQGIINRVDGTQIQVKFGEGIFIVSDEEKNKEYVVFDENYDGWDAEERKILEFMKATNDPYTRKLIYYIFMKDKRNAKIYELYNRIKKCEYEMRRKVTIKKLNIYERDNVMNL